MENLTEAFSDHPVVSWSMAGAATVATIYVSVKLVGGSLLFSKKGKTTVAAPPGTVILCQVKRGTRAPSLSPFPVKLETFLRIAKIPYVNDLTGKMSSKNKTPWITLDGVEVADSQLCIEYLNKNMNINLNKSLSLEEKAVSRSLQVLIDEHLYWTLVYFRWSHDPDLKVVKEHISLPAVMWWYVRRLLRTQLHGQGMGRHTHQEVLGFLVDDLAALDGYLGNKPYLMGGQLTEVDCSAFGMLCQLVFMQEDAIMKDLVKDKFPKLHKYTHRIKEVIWPDWEEVITAGDKYKSF